jgi:hypothetical protein
MAQQISNPRIVLLTVYQLEHISEFIHNAQRQRIALEVFDDPPP